MFTLNKFIVIFTIIIVVVYAGPAFGEKHLGEMAQGIIGQTSSVGITLVAIGGVIGFYLLIFGALQLKKADSKRGSNSSKYCSFS